MIDEKDSFIRKEFGDKLFQQTMIEAVANEIFTNWAI